MTILVSKSSLFRTFSFFAVLALAIHSHADAATVTTTATGAQNWSDNTVWSSGRTGTVSATPSSMFVNGSGTMFTTELHMNDVLVNPLNGAVVGTVASITDDTHVTLTALAASTLSSSPYGVQIGPQTGDDVIIGNPASALDLVLTLDVSATINSLTIAAAPSNVTFDLGSSPTALHVTTNVMITAANATFTNTLDGDANTMGLIIGGDLTVDGTGASNATAVLNVNNGAFSIGGNLSCTGVSSAANIDIDGGNVTLTGQFNFSGGYTASGPSTYNFNGNGPLTIPALPYAYVFINGNRGANSVTFAPGTTAIFNDLGLGATFTSGNYVTTGNLIRFTGNAPQSITNTGNVMPVFNDLRNDEQVGGTVFLHSNILVQGQLMFNTGKFNTMSNTLMIGTAGTSTGANSSSYVVGNMSKAFVAANGQAFQLSIGDATNFTPVALSNVNVTTPGSVTVNTTAGNHPQIATSGFTATKTAARYWTLSNSGLAGTFDSAFNFVAGDVSAGNPANFVVKQFNGSAWNATTLGAVTANSTQATGLNFTTLGDFQAGELAAAPPPPIMPPMIGSIAAPPPPVIVGTPVMLSAVATDPQSLPLTFTWDFGDGTALGTGNPVTHSFSIEGNLTVTLTVSNGTMSSTLTQMVATIAPNSGAQNIPNIAQGQPAVVDPVTNLGIAVLSSDGGIIQLSIDVSQLRGAYNISTDFNSTGGRSSTVTGATPLIKFTSTGVFVAHVTATDAATGALKGEGRKTLLISSAEVGAPAQYTALPSNSTASKVVVGGKLNFHQASRTVKSELPTPLAASGGGTDTLTFSGIIELPAGFNITAAQTFYVGLSNIIDSVNLDTKGKAKLPSQASLIKKFTIKYPHLNKGVTLTPAKQMATVSLTLSGSNFSANGAATDGITNVLVGNEIIKTPLNRSIQVGLEIAGVPYQFSLPVQLKLSTDGMSGSLGGRSVH